MTIETSIPAPGDVPASPAPSEPPAQPWKALYPDDVPQEPAALSEQPTAEEKPAEGPPTEYEFALEGLTLDPGMIAEAEPILRELNLTNDGANKLVPVAAKLVSSAQDRTMQALVDAGAKQKKDWLAAYHADPKIGGGNRTETERLAATAMGRLGFGAGHPFRQMLNESGLGNHPDMIRTFRMLGEFIAGGSGAAPTNAPAWKALYPDDN